MAAVHREECARPLLLQCSRTNVVFFTPAFCRFIFFFNFFSFFFVFTLTSTRFPFLSPFFLPLLFISSFFFFLACHDPRAGLLRVSAVHGLPDGEASQDCRGRGSSRRQRSARTTRHRTVVPVRIRVCVHSVDFNE